MLRRLLVNLPSFLSSNLKLKRAYSWDTRDTRNTWDIHGYTWDTWNTTNGASEQFVRYSTIFHNIPRTQQYHGQHTPRPTGDSQLFYSIAPRTLPPALAYDPAAGRRLIVFGPVLDR